MIADNAFDETTFVSTKLPEAVTITPTKMETLFVNLRVNGNIAIDHSMPWIVDDVEEKIQNAIGMDNLKSI